MVQRTIRPTFTFIIAICRKGINKSKSLYSLVLWQLKRVREKEREKEAEKEREQQKVIQLATDCH